MLRSTTPKSYLLLLSCLAPVGLVAATGCGDTINHYNSYYEQPGTGGAGDAGGDSGNPTAGAGGDPTPGGSGGEAAGGEAGGGAGGAPPDDGHLAYPNAPYADVSPADQELKLFETMGSEFWFGVSDEQLEAINGSEGGGPIIIDKAFGDIYSPDGSDGTTFADHLWITTPGADGQTADYGKVKVKLAGQSTRRVWSKTSIPNLNIDSNEFVEGQLIGGYEHLRLNNGQVGSIFREWLSLTLYSALDYPAPQATFAFMASNVWKPNVRVPMVLVERYKRKFCTRFEEFGGNCPSMWEFAGDFGNGNGGPIPIFAAGAAPQAAPSLFDDPENCQFDKCDATRAKELEQLLSETQNGDGFKQATSDYIDWPAFHRFQCLSWVLATGDDALHNSNNVVLAEGADGKFRYLPYSTDISLGQEWYAVVALPGTNRVAQGCQSETSCWQDTIAACEDVIADFTALNPVGMLENLHDNLDALGMLRPGDEGRYELLLDWFESRLRDLPAELETYRDNPSQCPKGQVDCGGGVCDLPENCKVCVPPVGVKAQIGVGEPAPGGGGVCPAIQNYAAPE
jgi:hypothetical protein